MLRIVEKAEMVPGRCAVSGSPDGPFFDSGVDIQRYGRVYVSCAATRAMGTDLGMADAGNIVTLTQRVVELEAEVVELDAFKEAVDTVFKKLDRTPPKARRKPGPKPKTTE